MVGAPGNNNISARRRAHDTGREPGGPGEEIVAGSFLAPFCKKAETNALSSETGI